MERAGWAPSVSCSKAVARGGMEWRKRASASLLPEEVWDRERIAVNQVAAKKMQQRLSLQVVSVSHAAELFPAYAPSTLERLFSSVTPLGRGNAACFRRVAKPGAFAMLWMLLRSNSFFARSCCRGVMV